MLKTTETLIAAGLQNKVFTFYDCLRVLTGTHPRVYGLINKAIAKGDLIALRRGQYVLNTKYNTVAMSEYYIAGQLLPHSYISMENALSSHGWIPERVTSINSALHTGRSTTITTPLGEYNYSLILVMPYEFLTGVERRVLNQQPYLIASPIRALLDYVYDKKIVWQGLDFMIDSLRIESENLLQIDNKSFNDMKRVYKSKRMLNFLDKFEAEVNKYAKFYNRR